MKVGWKHRYQQNQRPFFVPERVDVVRNLLSPDDSRPFRPLARRDPVEASFMSGNACIRFDVAALRALAGAIVYRRGEVVHRDGRVTIVETEPNRIVASVEGTRNYGTTLAGASGLHRFHQGPARPQTQLHDSVEVTRAPQADR